MQKTDFRWLQPTRRVAAQAGAALVCMALALPLSTVAGESGRRAAGASACDTSSIRLRPSPTEDEPLWQRWQRGLASWYGDAFHNRRTANGERFDMNGFTAAHRTLPFGTEVTVRNPRNNRTVVVRINDRGPHIGNRSIDLSRAAASALGILNRGTAQVELLLEAPGEALFGGPAGCATGKR